MKAFFFALICFLIALPAHSGNSLVEYEDVPVMKALGVSQELISYILKNQTSSISSKDVIRMKQSGMTNEEILAAIKPDLRNPQPKTTAMEEAELIVRLKESGMSDEAVLQFIHTVKTTRRVDSDGNTIVIHSTDPRPPYPTSGTAFPEVDDYAYDGLTERFIFLSPRYRKR
jgi:hypothetical protein